MIKKLACSRVLEVPELLNIICGSARTSDCARLLRTCKAIFRVSTEHVWKHVDGRSLLLLFGATQLHDTNLNSGNPKKIVIRIPSTSVLDFSRFRVYASCVRTLEVYGPGPAYQYYQVRGWNDLIIRGAHQQPLLPRLSCIHLQSPQDAYGEDQLIWIRTFSSPSLAEIRTIANSNSSPTYIPLIMANLILDTVTRCCPRLQKLSLFLLENPSHESIEPTDGLLGFLWTRPFHKSLSNMSNLVELTGSLTILKKENLLVISSLPALHRLAILGIYGPDVLEPEGLSMDSFPALRELRLAGLVTYDQVSVLGILPIMRHLTHLELECSIDYDDADEGNPDDEWIASELLPQLGNSPELLCLVLKFKHSRQNYIPCDIRGIALTEIFPKLPLEQVILEGACVYSWEYLTEAWANVSSIRISDQCVGMEELEVLTQLPRLQYLRMCLDLAGVGGWVARLETSQSPLHILESSKPGAIGVEPEELEDTAEVLLKLFPNLQELVWTRGSEAERAFVEILNQHIVLKREIEEMKMKIGVMST